MVRVSNQVYQLALSCSACPGDGGVIGGHCGHDPLSNHCADIISLLAIELLIVIEAPAECYV